MNVFLALPSIYYIRGAIPRGQRTILTTCCGVAVVGPTELMTIQDIDRSEDNTPVTLEGIPNNWEIKAGMLKLHCKDGRPIELGRGGYGVVLYGEDAPLMRIRIPAR